MTDEPRFDRVTVNAVFLSVIMVLSVVAMSAALAGSAAAQDASVDKTNLDGEIFFAGQQVEVTGLDTADGETVQLRSYEAGETSFETNLVVNDSSVTVDTSDREGQWVIRDAGTDYGPFEVTEQTVSFEFMPGAVEADPGASSELHWESDNRMETVDLQVGSANFSQDELDDMFGEAADPIPDTDMVMIADASQGDSWVVDLGGVEPGTYDFDIHVADTTASDTATVSVLDEDVPQPELVESVVSSTHGDYGAFTVDLDGASSTTVELIVDIDGQVVSETAVEITAEEDAEEVTVEPNNFYLGTDEIDADGNYLAIDDVEGAEDFSVDIGAHQAHYPSAMWDWTDRATIEVYDGAHEVRHDRGVYVLGDAEIGDIDTAVTAAPTLEALDEASLDSDTAAYGDYVAVTVEASGIHGYQANWSDFGIAVTAEEFGFDPVQWDTEAEYSDAANERAVFFYNTTVMNEEYGGEQPELQHDFTFSVTGVADDPDDGNPIHDTTSLETSFFTEPAWIEFDDDHWEVDADEGQEITGTTNVAPGEGVNLDAEADVFFLTGSAETTADGTFAVPLDFSGQPEGEEFTLTLDWDRGEPITATGVVGDAPVDEEAELELTVATDAELLEGTPVPFTITVAEVGGADWEDDIDVTLELFDETHLDTTIEGGLDAEGQWVEDVSVPSEGMEPGDYEWTVTADDLEETGTLTLNPDEEDDADIPDEDEDDDDDVPPEDDDDDEPVDDDEQPGFGVAIALIAVLGAALLAVRLQNR